MVSKTFIPKIRFKGFSEDWKDKRLDSISEQISYGLTVRPKYIEVGIPLISARELKNGNINYNIAPKISVKSYDDLSEKAKAKKGDIFLTKTGTVGLSSYVSEDFPIAVTQNIAVIRVTNERYNHQFILQTFKTQIFYKTAMSKVNQSTIMDLQLQDIRALSIFFPEKKEQIKISNYLQQLDKLIEQKEKKHQKLKQFKKAMLYKMFPKDGANTPEIRFDGFSGEWEEKRLDKIVEIVGGGTPSTMISDYWNGTIDWYSPTEIGKEIFVSSSVKKITQLGLEKSSARILPAKRTVLFTSRAGIGDMAILNKDGATNQGFQSLILKDEYDTYFVYSMGHLIKEYALRNASGSTFLEISGKQLSNMNIRIPSFNEQTKIGNYFQKLDKQIELQSKEIQKLKNIKKASLDKMFV